MQLRRKRCIIVLVPACWGFATVLRKTGKMQKICFRRIVVHTCINVLKKNKKFSDSVDITFAGGIGIREESIPSIMQAKEVVECIRLLPIGYRTVLNLYAIEGYSHKEIGNMLDIEESTSRSQYTRAKQMLEEILVRKKIILKSGNVKTNYFGAAIASK